MSLLEFKTILFLSTTVGQGRHLVRPLRKLAMYDPVDPVCPMSGWKCCCSGLGLADVEGCVMFK